MVQTVVSRALSNGYRIESTFKAYRLQVIGYRLQVTGASTAELVIDSLVNGVDIIQYVPQAVDRVKVRYNV